MAARYQKPGSRPNIYNRQRSDSPYYDRQQGRDQDWNNGRSRDNRNGQNSRYASRGGVMRQQGGGRQNPRYRDYAGRGDMMSWTNAPADSRNRIRRDSPQKQDRQPLPEQADPSTYVEVGGVLETHPNGYGFLRNPKENYARLPPDPYVSAQIITKKNLRPGVMIEGLAAPSQSETGARPGSRLMEIKTIAGKTPEEYAEIKPFDEMVPINPEFWIKLSTGAEPISTRVMDLLTPLGKGQRALIVAPPRSVGPRPLAGPRCVGRHQPLPVPCRRQASRFRRDPEKRFSSSRSVRRSSPIIRISTSSFF